MKKGSRYAMAFLACVAIFILWIVFQTFVAKGTLIGIIFCGAMVSTWRAIVSRGTDSSEIVDESAVEKCVDTSDSVRVEESDNDGNGSIPDNALEMSVDELMDITGSSVQRNILKRVYIYEFTLLRISGDKSKARIVGGALARKDFGIDETVANQVYDYVLKRYARDNFGGDNDRLIELLNASFGNGPLNCRNDVINGATGPYGICVTNPIPVRGIPQSGVYLSHLRTMAGGRISWERFGSLGSPVSEYPVDLYFIYDESGAEAGRIYISAYQTITSQTPPEGFMYEKE